MLGISSTDCLQSVCCVFIVHHFVCILATQRLVHAHKDRKKYQETYYLWCEPLEAITLLTSLGKEKSSQTDFTETFLILVTNKNTNKCDQLYWIRGPTGKAGILTSVLVAHMIGNSDLQVQR